MKIEKLSKGNSKIFLAGVVITLVLVVIINLFLSYSKYKLESSVDLAEGTVNYTIPDLKLMAIYIKDENGTFKEGTIQSNTTYQVVKGEGENTSYCIDQTTGKKIDDVYMKFEDGKIDIKVDKKGTKCWVYLEKAKYLNEDILAKNPPKESTYNETYPHIAEFTGISTTDDGVYSMVDYDGEPTYYFRGAVTDNYVKFANFYWRIIRINSDGSIRMIYDGKSVYTNDEESEDRQIGTSPYNENYADAKYVGFKYGGEDPNSASGSYKEAVTNTNNSIILDKLEEWYGKNLVKYDSYIEKNAFFCNDRRSGDSFSVSYIDWLETGAKNSNGFGKKLTAYGARMRVYAGKWLLTQYADLSCQPNDRFTSSDATKGNKAMKYPIGLITLDDVLMGGGFGNQANDKFYLYTGQYYWTMTSGDYNVGGGSVGVYRVHGGVVSGMVRTLTGNKVTFELGVRPVINLKANTTFSKGDGSMQSPYEII